MLNKQMAGLEVVKQGNASSPKTNLQAQLRQRIISPSRKRFETNFDDWLVNKYIEEPILSIPEKKEEMMNPPPFDTVTKPVGSLNAKQLFN